MSFTNKVVIITGAGSGIGEAAAVNFAKLSATLSLLDNDDNLDKVVEQCEILSNAKVLKIVVDVSKDEDLKQAVADTLKECKKIDVVVNCAGNFSHSEILDTDIISLFDRDMKVNLRSIIAMTHYSLAALIESKGCVINIASIMASKDSISYKVAREGILHFTNNVAMQLADREVRVNCIIPGQTTTKVLLYEGYSPEQRQRFYKDIDELQRQIKMEEIARIVEYLASDKSNGISGAEIIIESGYVLSGTQNCFI